MGEIEINISEEQLRNTATELATRMFGVQALLTPSEAALLYTLAKQWRTDGVVVEIGSHLGGGAVALGLGTQDGGGGAVVCIDKWDSDHAGQVRWNNTDNLFPTMWRNVRDKDCGLSVVGIRGKSGDVAGWWGNPIRVLFIDGDHSYDGVKADFEAWSRFVWKSGAVAFHDCDIEPGVTRFVKELAAANGDFEPLCQVDSIAVFGRKDGSAVMWPW